MNRRYLLTALAVGTASLAGCVAEVSQTGGDSRTERASNTPERRAGTNVSGSLDWEHTAGNRSDEGTVIESMTNETDGTINDEGWVGFVEQRSEQQFTVDLTVRNRDDVRHSVDTAIRYEGTPECRNSDPPCAGPPGRSILILDSTHELEPGATKAVSGITLTLTELYIDSYEITVGTDGVDRTRFEGIEAGANRTGENSDEKDWCFAAKSYDILVTVTDTGAVETAVIDDDSASSGY